MPNTALEANIRAIGDGARLEQLAVDLLGREGYDVDSVFDQNLKQSLHELANLLG